MTTTEAKPTTRSRKGKSQQGTKEPCKAAVLPPTRGKRRPMVIAIGVAIAIVGGLASWWIATESSNTQTVFVATTVIERGDVITADDLGTLQLAGGQNTNAVPSTNPDAVIGKSATVELPAGSLITTDALGEGVSVEKGYSIVGVALSSGQLPSQQLSPGDAVRVVDTPVAQGDPPTSTPQTFDAIVFGTKFDEQANQWIVDLKVADENAADVAARAATGRIALILDAGEASE